MPVLRASTRGLWRAVAAGISTVAAGAAGVVTALATAHPSAGLWAALSVLVVGGAVLQAAVVAGERRSARRVGGASGEELGSDGGGAADTGAVRNTISGGTFRGPVVQGRDFTGLSFGASPGAAPADAPGDQDQ
jgi:hypothetical protein